MTSAPAGGESEVTGQADTGGGGHHRHARNPAGLASEADRPKIRTAVGAAGSNARGNHPAVVPEVDRHQFDGSKYRSYPGRPRVTPELEALILKTAKENSGLRYDRIVGALANLGHRVSDQTVGSDRGLTRRRNQAKTQPGRSSSSRIWRYWPGSTSSPSKCSRGAIW